MRRPRTGRRWSVDLRYQRPGEPTGFPPKSKLPPMRKSDDPDHRLDWEAWIAAEQGKQEGQKYRDLQDDEFDFAPPDAPWLVRWQKYWDEVA